MMQVLWLMKVLLVVFLMGDAGVVVDEGVVGGVFLMGDAGVVVDEGAVDGVAVDEGIVVDLFCCLLQTLQLSL